MVATFVTITVLVCTVAVHIESLPVAAHEGLKKTKSQATNSLDDASKLVVASKLIVGGS